MTQQPTFQVIVTETKDPSRRARLDDLICRTLAGEFTMKSPHKAQSIYRLDPVDSQRQAVEHIEDEQWAAEITA